MAKKINTAPIYPRPRQEQVDEAKRAARRIKEYVIPDCLIMDDVFARYVIQEGHSTAAALWAIHELCLEKEFKVYRLDDIPEKKKRWEFVTYNRRPSGLVLEDGVLHYDDRDGKSEWNNLCFEPVQDHFSVNSSRPCYDRDHIMLELYEKNGSPTYRSPATIRDRWNSENPDDKIGSGTAGADVVKKAIKQARSDVKKSKK